MASPGARVVERIRRSGLTIYDDLESHPDLLIDHELLEKILNRALVGLSLDFPLRTRSKILKAAVCQALGYPVPASFKRTRPKFPGQNFDTYVQKANNLQIWNEQVTASRRYVLVRVGDDRIVSKVRVVTGEVISRLDRTGTLTHKYQARAQVAVVQPTLVTPDDTPNVVAKLIRTKHASWPDMLPIRKVFDRLKALLGTTIPDPGSDQERSRGGNLHERACQQLGMRHWKDDGQFPDVTEQLLEIKLQTAPTIDLGLVCPDQEDFLADSTEIRHCDVRYAVFYGKLVKEVVRLDALALVTGAGFFSYFTRFGGMVKNAQLQIPLPGDFFDQAK